MYKLAALALAATAVQGGLVAPYAGLNVAPYAGLYNGAPLAYNYPAGLAAPLYAGAYAGAYATPYAAPVATPAVAAVPAPVAAAPVAVAAKGYALPPVRTIQEEPLVSQTVEKVEQHGYKRLFLQCHLAVQRLKHRVAKDISKNISSYNSKKPAKKPSNKARIDEPCTYMLD